MHWQPSPELRPDRWQCTLAPETFTLYDLRIELPVHFRIGEPFRVRLLATVPVEQARSERWQAMALEMSIGCDGTKERHEVSCFHEGSRSAARVLDAPEDIPPASGMVAVEYRLGLRVSRRNERHASEQWFMELLPPCDAMERSAFVRVHLQHPPAITPWDIVYAPDRAEQLDALLSPGSCEKLIARAYNGIDSSHPGARADFTAAECAAVFDVGFDELIAHALATRWFEREIEQRGFIFRSGPSVLLQRNGLYRAEEDHDRNGGSTLFSSANLRELLRFHFADTPYSEDLPGAAKYRASLSPP